MKADYQKSYPTVLSNLEKVLKSNNKGQGFFVGSEVSWLCLVNTILDVSICMRFTIFYRTLE